MYTMRYKPTFLAVITIISISKYKLSETGNFGKQSEIFVKVMKAENQATASSHACLMSILLVRYMQV